MEIGFIPNKSATFKDLSERIVPRRMPRMGNPPPDDMIIGQEMYLREACEQDDVKLIFPVDGRFNCVKCTAAPYLGVVATDYILRDAPPPGETLPVTGTPCARMQFAMWETNLFTATLPSGTLEGGEVIMIIPEDKIRRETALLAEGYTGPDRNFFLRACYNSFRGSSFRPEVQTFEPFNDDV